MCEDNDYPYSDGYDAGYSSGANDGYYDGRNSRDWEIDDLYEDVARLERAVTNLKIALTDAGIHPNLVEAIANG